MSATIYLFISLFQDKSNAYIESLTIYGGAVLATLIAAWAEHKQERQFLKIEYEVNNTTVTVFRGQYGTESEIFVKDLVVGDVISVQQGDIVPADCILIEEMNIFIDETKYGNGMAVEKEPSAITVGDDDPDNHKSKNPDICLLTGSMVMSGCGRAVVCAVGENTSIGSLGKANNLEIKGSNTPLKQKLEESCAQITKYCIFFTIIIVMAQVLNLVIVIMTVKEKGFLSGNTMADFMHIFIIALCILIVAIPEGMPLAVSLAMALSIDKLKSHSILIKNLEAIQICATLHDVCIGKTGTLTMNHMNVRKMSLLNRQETIEFNGDQQFFENNNVNDKLSKVIHRCVIGGTSAWLGINEDPDHFVTPGNSKFGYKEPLPEEANMGEFHGPYHEPKGNDIEKALL